jgi:hypothetical protein
MDSSHITSTELPPARPELPVTRLEPATTRPESEARA